MKMAGQLRQAPGAPFRARGTALSHGGHAVGWTGPSLPPSQATAPYNYSLEHALIDSFKREAVAAAAAYASTAGVSAVAYLRSSGGRSAAVPYFGDDGISQGSSPLRQWWDKIAGENREAEKNFDRWEFAAIVMFDRRYQPPQPIINAYALSPAIVGPLRDLETKVGGRLEFGAGGPTIRDQENQMNTYGDYVGAEGGSHPEVASRAVRSASQQRTSPVYGYLRAPVEGISHQRIYLFNTLDEAHGWFTGLVYDPAQLYDYVAVFAATDLSRPVPGLESFGHTTVSGDPQVGNLWPFLLGLPLGGLGGYFYRGWRDEHPGRWIPGISGDPSVGGPWLDIEPYGGSWLDMVGNESYGVGNEPYVGGPWLDLADPYAGGPWLDMVGNEPYAGGSWLDSTGPYVGGPWVDIVGAEQDPRDRRRAWRQTRALIESAKREIMDAQARAPAPAWVWNLSPPGLSLVPGVEIEAVAQLTPFSSIEQAQAYMFELAHTPHIALALFDTAAMGHWPNPVRWSKSDDPAYEPLIAQRAAQGLQVRAAGDRIGASPRTTAIDTALGDVRSRAQTIAGKRAGNVVGVIHTTKDKLWHALAFRNADDADDWLETQDQAAYTYAAYYDKDDATWPNPVIEKIGGFRAGKVKTSGALIGAALDDTRAHAKALASAKQGNAAGVLRLEDGSWSTFVFPDLDAAIDWLSSMTARRASFTYAAAFEKGADGMAYIQQEEFGIHPVTPMPRALAATSGEHAWWAV